MVSVSLSMEMPGQHVYPTVAFFHVSSNSQDAK